MASAAGGLAASLQTLQAGPMPKVEQEEPLASDPAGDEADGLAEDDDVAPPLKQPTALEAVLNKSAVNQLQDGAVASVR